MQWTRNNPLGDAGTESSIWPMTSLKADVENTLIANQFQTKFKPNPTDDSERFMNVSSAQEHSRLPLVDTRYASSDRTDEVLTETSGQWAGRVLSKPGYAAESPGVLICKQDEHHEQFNLESDQTIFGTQFEHNNDIDLKQEEEANARSFGWYMLGTKGYYEAWEELDERMMAARKVVLFFLLHVDVIVVLKLCSK